MWFDILKIEPYERAVAEEFADEADYQDIQNKRLRRNAIARLKWRLKRNPTKEELEAYFGKPTRFRQLEEKWERMKAGEPYDAKPIKTYKPRKPPIMRQQELTPHNPKVKRVGKSAIKNWIKDFIRKHLESMAVGEKITTDEMVEILNANVSNATFLGPRGNQVRFSSNTKFDKHINNHQVGTILMRQNTDIVDVPISSQGLSKGYVVRK